MKNWIISSHKPMLISISLREYIDWPCHYLSLGWKFEFFCKYPKQILQLSDNVFAKKNFDAWGPPSVLAWMPSSYYVPKKNQSPRYSFGFERPLERLCNFLFLKILQIEKYKVMKSYVVWTVWINIISHSTQNKEF